MELPRYKVLRNKLRSQILSGEFSPGVLLPSENELSAEHEINRMTVRQALNELVNEGLITKKKGKGSVVLASRKTLGLLSFKGFSEVVGGTECSVKNIYLKQPVISEWQQPFFYTLSKEELSAQCIAIERLRIAADDPIMLEHTFIPNIDVPDFGQNLEKNGSLFNTLELNYQIRILNVSQDIRAIEAPDEVVMPLSVTRKAPILHIYRKYGTSRPGFYIYSSLYCNTGNYTIGNNF